MLTNPPPTPVIYAQSGWLANQHRHTICHTIENGYWIAIDGISNFIIQETTQVINIHYLVQTPTQQQLQEVILGPALILAFALQNIYCLHASSVLVNGQLFAFAGDSGQGKSTIAAALSQLDCQRMSDDILPIMLLNNTLTALPHYPQLKLKTPLDHQSLPSTIPLYMLCLLETHPQHDPTLTPNPANLAALKLHQHTVAVRLFSPQQLKKHLSFCATASNETPITHLSYPRQLSIFSAIKTLLMQNQ